MPTYTIQTYYVTPDIGAVEVGPPAAPVNTAAPTISPTSGFAVGTVLSTTNGTWSNNPTSYAYQWLRAGSNISGATSSSYTIQTADVGADIAVVVTATNVTGSASATASPVTMPNIPTYSVAPTISGNNVVGAVLTVANGTWSDNPTSYSYQWKRSGSVIAGATSSTYTIVLADAGQSLTVTVSASNSFGTSATVDTNAITIPGSIYGQGAALLGIEILEHPDLPEASNTITPVALRPIFMPVYPEGLLVMTLQALRTNVVTAGASGELATMALYTFNYTALNTFSVSLVGVTPSFSVASTGIKTTDMTGAPFALDFTQNKYLVSLMTNSSTAAFSAAAPSYSGYSVLRTNVARSSVTDWPASFTQTSASAFTSAYPYAALLTATAKFYL